MDATTIGVDLAKTVFELALVNAACESWGGSDSRVRSSIASSQSSRRRIS
jgi:hypothetical protein